MEWRGEGGWLVAAGGRGWGLGGAGGTAAAGAPVCAVRGAVPRPGGRRALLCARTCAPCCWARDCTVPGGRETPLGRRRARARVGRSRVACVGMCAVPARARWGRGRVGAYVARFRKGAAAAGIRGGGSRPSKPIPTYTRGAARGAGTIRPCGSCRGFRVYDLGCPGAGLPARRGCAAAAPRRAAPQLPWAAPLCAVVPTLRSTAAARMLRCHPLSWCPRWPARPPPWPAARRGLRVPAGSCVPLLPRLLAAPAL